MAGQQHSSVFDRLTDSKLYTGAHKHRFDENGNGRGLAGRDRIAKGHGFITGATGAGVADLSQITRPNLHTTGAGYATPPSPLLSPTGGPLLYLRGSGSDGVAPGTPLSPTGPGTPTQRPGSVGRSAMRSSYSGAAPAGGGTATRASDSGERKGSIFDRLNDPSSYTGMHKNRFSSDGRGRGAAGRAMPAAYVSPMDNCRR